MTSVPTGTAGADEATTATAYWVSLLRYIGCTGHAHEVATLFGDEIAIRARTLVHDAAQPAEVLQIPPMASGPRQLTGRR